MRARPGAAAPALALLRAPPPADASDRTPALLRAPPPATASDRTPALLRAPPPAAARTAGA